MQTCTSGRRTRCASARTSLADRRAIKLRGRGLGLKQLNVLLPVAIVARVTAQKVGQRTVGTSYQTFEQVSQSPSVTQCAIIRVVAPTADCTGPNFFHPSSLPERRARTTPHPCMVADGAESLYEQASFVYASGLSSSDSIVLVPTNQMFAHESPQLSIEDASINSQGTTGHRPASHHGTTKHFYPYVSATQCRRSMLAHRDLLWLFGVTVATPRTCSGHLLRLEE